MNGCSTARRALWPECQLRVLQIPSEIAMVVPDHHSLSAQEPDAVGTFAIARCLLEWLDHRGYLPNASSMKNECP